MPTLSHADSREMAARVRHSRTDLAAIVGHTEAPWQTSTGRTDARSADLVTTSSLAPGNT